MLTGMTGSLIPPDRPRPAAADDPSLGFVLTRQGAHVQAIRKDDGGVSLVDLRTLAALDLDAANRDALRELLDRAAMPGVASGG
jgi:hypothetical protein